MNEVRDWCDQIDGVYTETGTGQVCEFPGGSGKLVVEMDYAEIVDRSQGRYQVRHGGSDPKVHPNTVGSRPAPDKDAIRFECVENDNGVLRFENRFEDLHLQVIDRDKRRDQYMSV